MANYRLISLVIAILAVALAAFVLFGNVSKLGSTSQNVTGGFSFGPNTTLTSLFSEQGTINYTVLAQFINYKFNHIGAFHVDYSGVSNQKFSNGTWISTNWTLSFNEYYANYSALRSSPAPFAEPPFINTSVYYLNGSRYYFCGNSACLSEHKSFDLMGLLTSVSSQAQNNITLKSGGTYTFNGKNCTLLGGEGYLHGGGYFGTNLFNSSAPELNETISICVSTTYLVPLNVTYWIFGYNALSKRWALVRTESEMFTSINNSVSQATLKLPHLPIYNES